jgi:DNA-directed RNA polymerase subunit RPC12/RpoP
MSSTYYKCEDCKKEFMVRVLWFKSRELNCPYCGSSKVTGVGGRGPCGSGNKENKGGFTFG